MGGNYCAGLDWGWGVVNAEGEEVRDKGKSRMGDGTRDRGRDTGTQG